MKALSLLTPKHWQLIDIPEPPAPAPGNVVVRVHQVGVCGTDISGYLGKMPFFSYPRIPGHELGVEVVAVGSGVSNVKPGDKCSIEPYINCQNCHACRRGFTNCCESNQTLGVHCDGGLTPLFTIPARKLHVSTKLNYEQLALVETLAIGCHAVNRAAIVKQDVVAVIGAGPIGLSVIEFVKLTGARLIVVDINENRLQFCRDVMGVQHTLKTDENLAKNLTELSGGHLPDVVIDATGHTGSMSNGYELIANGNGRLVYVGITTDEVKFRHAVFHRPEGTLLCSRNALPDDFTRIINLIETGQLNTAPWVTHRTGFEEVIQVFPSYILPETGVLKAMIAVGN
ncbi:MAG: zinc-binding alcohol dehydrogenase family protein [Planctomycetota bacterium]|nr:zinc-binding alcohol dehydrogenase family protein [Planctomycetota bacterium]